MNITEQIEYKSKDYAPPKTSDIKIQRQFIASKDQHQFKIGSFIKRDLSNFFKPDEKVDITKDYHYKVSSVPEID